MEIEDNGNKVIAYISEANIPNKKINIKSDLANYLKKEQILNFSNNVKLNDVKNNLFIEGDKIKYEKDKDLFYSHGNTKFNVDNKYIIYSKNVYYDRKIQVVYGNDLTKIEDMKTKEASRLIFGDVLRIAENNKNRMKDITYYFAQKKK